MCTVTYVPKNKDEFFLTQNRDVAPHRFAERIHQEHIGQNDIIYPVDKTAQGTWISASSDNRGFCLMNGAFLPHNRHRTFRKSRGVLALEFYEYPSAFDFFNKIDLAGIEPFTMVAFDANNLYEFRWDENKKHLLLKDPQSRHLWASCTLYDNYWLEQRNKWFEKWGKNFDSPNLDNIIEFHQNAGVADPENDLVMNRSNLVATTSICALHRKNDIIEMTFNSLIEKIEIKKSVPILS